LVVAWEIHGGEDLFLQHKNSGRCTDYRSFTVLYYLDSPSRTILSSVGATWWCSHVYISGLLWGAVIQAVVWGGGCYSGNGTARSQKTTLPFHFHTDYKFDSSLSHNKLRSIIIVCRSAQAARAAMA
jgi:hypothetical protein